MITACPVHVDGNPRGQHERDHIAGQAEFPHLLHVQRQAGRTGTRCKGQQLHGKYRTHVGLQRNTTEETYDQRITYEQDEAQPDDDGQGIIAQGQQQIDVTGEADHQIGHQRHHPQRSYLHHIVDDPQNNRIQRLDDPLDRSRTLPPDRNHRYGKDYRQQDQLKHRGIVACGLNHIFGDQIFDKMERPLLLNHLCRLLFFGYGLLIMDSELFGFLAWKHKSRTNHIYGNQPDKYSKYSGY